MKLLNKDLNRKAIAVLGFKKDTDDIRESASIKLIKDLTQRGAVIRVHDPLALDNTKEQFGNSIEYSRDVIQCITITDCAILMTEWEEYKKLSTNLSYVIFKKYMQNPNVVDARRVITSKRMKGINFLAIGMGNKKRQKTRRQI